jgi:DNA processing protein
MGEFTLKASWIFGLLHGANQHSGRRPPLEGLGGLPLSDSPGGAWEDPYFWFEILGEFLKTQIPSALWLSKLYPTGDTQWVLAKLMGGHMDRCKKEGATYITMGCERYPRRLRSIPAPPLALTFLGDPPAHHVPALALVGSRRASFGAIKESYGVGQLIPRITSPVYLMSGGAYGCDIAAHKGCLSTDRNPLLTGTVFAGGLGELYPKGHLGIFSQLVQRGGFLVSERFWFETPKPYDFPHRNRIISGLSQKVIVIHAGVQSGAMTTCSHALDQGREILVLHPAQGDDTMDGNLKLISEGAVMFYNSQELLCHL